MIKLTARRSRLRYKSTDAWIDAVYRNNKELIDEKFNVSEHYVSNKLLFKRLVKEYIRQGLTPEQGVKTLSRSTIFTPTYERMQMNAYSGLVSDKEALYNFRKAVGFKTKLDLTKFRYDKQQKVYFYGDTGIYLSFKNSPKEVLVKQVQPDGSIKQLNDISPAKLKRLKAGSLI